MTATQPGHERPPPENESPGTVPAAPGQAIPTQRQDKARKATLQGSTAAPPNWKDVAQEARTENRACSVIKFPGPRLAPERDGAGWLVLRSEHGWLHGDRRQALRERDEINRAESFPWRGSR
jgi:hypothetical protein